MSRVPAESVGARRLENYADLARHLLKVTGRIGGVNRADGICELGVRRDGSKSLKVSHLVVAPSLRQRDEIGTSREGTEKGNSLA